MSANSLIAWEIVDDLTDMVFRISIPVEKDSSGMAEIMSGAEVSRVYLPPKDLRALRDWLVKGSTAIEGD